MKTTKILFENTDYSILIYLLINGLDKSDIYFLDSRLEEKIIKKISNKIDKVTIFSNFKDSKLKKIINFIKLFPLIFIWSLKDIEVYGNDNSIFCLFFRWKGIKIIEDGLANYNAPILNRLKNIYYFSPINYKKNGFSKQVSKIYLTGLAPIPKEIAHKVEIIDLKELWNKKSLKEQNEILDIFSFDLNIKGTIKGRDIILFTQPLSEDGVITEDEKINIYSKIIKRYPQDRLIVKTHPREKTDYKDIFKEYLVLDNPFPFEILNLLDVKFSKAITLFSTAALGLGEGVEVDFYGTEVHDKILERFGSCDDIMKRNCFLKEE